MEVVISELVENNLRERRDDVQSIWLKQYVCVVTVLRTIVEVLKENDRKFHALDWEGFVSHVSIYNIFFISQ